MVTRPRCKPLGLKTFAPAVDPFESIIGILQQNGCDWSVLTSFGVGELGGYTTQGVGPSVAPRFPSTIDRARESCPLVAFRPPRLCFSFRRLP